MLFWARILVQVTIVGFFQRNLKACPKYIDKLEKNQRSAARFVTQNYSQTASMTSLIQNLGWTDLKTRRKNSRLVSMFKI